MNSQSMTKAERADLFKLVRARERVAKTATSGRAAELKADFEQQLATRYTPDDDPVWKEAYRIAEEAEKVSQAQVEQRCKELGIPEWAAPEVRMIWYGRGENAVKERRQELRKVAYSRIEAIEKAAKAEIERTSVDIQTKLIATGLASQLAKTFLEQMPSAEELMPKLALGEIEKMLSA
jgi:hypothetical protein